MKLAQKIAVAYIRARLALLSRLAPGLAAQQAFRLFCTPPSRDKVALPPVFQRADRLSFQLGRHKIAGYRWNRDGKRRVMILHGFESAATNFQAYVQPLIDKGYQVLAFDAPAHGRSTGKQVTPLDYADLVKYVQGNYGPVQSFLAHSFGGFALALALSEMEHDDQCRAVLIAPAAETRSAVDNFFRFLQLDERVRTRFEKIIEKRGGHPVDWFTVDRTLPLIRAQILWFHDETDTVTPFTDAMKVKQKNYPHVRFVFTNGLGHSRIYRDDQVIRQAVEFL